MTDRRRRAGDRLRDAILSLRLTACWLHDDAGSPLLEAMGSPGLVTLATSADADDIVDTVTPHGMVAGDPFTFASLTGGSNVAADTPYFVIATSLAAQTFKFALTPGGAAVSFGSDITAGAARTPWKRQPATVTGSPTYGVAGPDPLGRGITYPGSVYATAPVSIPVPSASMSVLAVFSLTDATAAIRYLAGRSAANQSSWGLSVGTTHVPRMTAFQSGGSNHCIATTGGAAVNDGRPHVMVGSFDGTTARVGQDSAAAIESTTIIGGAWHKASTAGISIAALGTTGTFLGTIHAIGYAVDRVITDAERLWISAIARGG